MQVWSSYAVTVLHSSGYVPSPCPSGAAETATAAPWMDSSKSEPVVRGVEACACETRAVATKPPNHPGPGDNGGDTAPAGKSCGFHG